MAFAAERKRDGMTVGVGSSEGFSAREEAVYLGRGTCDGDNDWIYNISNWWVLSSALRRDRCSALMTSRCRDMGERLHENHILPEGYLLAESTASGILRRGLTARIVWADSERRDGTSVGVQILGGADRHRLFWAEKTLDCGDRFYPSEDNKPGVLSREEADLLMAKGRYVHSRMRAEDLRFNVSVWARERYNAKAEHLSDNWESRDLLAEAAHFLAREHIFTSDQKHQTLAEDALETLNDAMFAGTETMMAKIMEALENTATLSDGPRPFTADYAIAKQVWREYALWSNPLKKSKPRDTAPHGI